MAPEELAPGPEIFALRWIQAVGHDRVDRAWPHMAPDYRLAVAQYWLIWNPAALADPSTAAVDRDELARVLSPGVPTALNTPVRHCL